MGLKPIALGLLHGAAEQTSTFIYSVRKIEGIQKCHVKVGEAALLRIKSILLQMSNSELFLFGLFPCVLFGFFVCLGISVSLICFGFY